MTFWPTLIGLLLIVAAFSQEKWAPPEEWSAVVGVILVVIAALSHIFGPSER